MNGTGMAYSFFVFMFLKIFFYGSLTCNRENSTTTTLPHKLAWYLPGRHPLSRSSPSILMLNYSAFYSFPPLTASSLVSLALLPFWTYAECFFVVVVVFNQAQYSLYWCWFVKCCHKHSNVRNFGKIILVGVKAKNLATKCTFEMCDFFLGV